MKYTKEQIDWLVNNVSGFDVNKSYDAKLAKRADEGILSDKSKRPIPGIEKFLVGGDGDNYPIETMRGDVNLMLNDGNANYRQKPNASAGKTSNQSLSYTPWKGFTPQNQSFMPSNNPTVDLYSGASTDNLYPQSNYSVLGRSPEDYIYSNALGSQSPRPLGYTPWPAYMNSTPTLGLSTDYNPTLYNNMGYKVSDKSPYDTLFSEDKYSIFSQDPKSYFVNVSDDGKSLSFEQDKLNLNQSDASEIGNVSIDKAKNDVWKAEQEKRAKEEADRKAKEEAEKARLEEEKRKAREESRLRLQEMNNAYAGSNDPASKFALAGAGFGYFANSKNPFALVGGIGNLASGLIGSAQNLASGYGYANMKIQMDRAQRDRVRNSENDAVEQAKEGGELENGGGVYLGIGQGTFGPESNTGEYFFPLPHSMEDRATAEVEGGEYIKTPDGSVYEAKGNKHSDGGMPIDPEPGTKVLSDKLKITNDFAKRIKDEYGFSCHKGNTYSTVMDGFKRHIGLDDLYSKMEKLYRKLDRNEAIQDENTRLLNSNIIGKGIYKTQTDIDEHANQMRLFFNVLYREQERNKYNEYDDYLFGEGGRIKSSQLKELCAKYGFREDKGRKMIVDEVMKKYDLVDYLDNGVAKRKLDKGGSVWENILGHDVVMSGFDTDQTNNPTWGLINGADAQSASGMYYGQANDEGFNMFMKRFAGKSFKDLALKNGATYDDKEKKWKLEDPKKFATWFQGDGTDTNKGWYNQYLTKIYEHRESFGNKDPFFKFAGQDVTLENLPQVLGFVPKSNKTNSSEQDGMMGINTISRGMFKGNVLPEGMKQKLQDIGINTWQDLLGAIDDASQKDKVRGVLGDYAGQLDKLKADTNVNELDFVLDEYKAPEPSAEKEPAETPAEQPVVEAKKPEEAAKKPEEAAKPATEPITPATTVTNAQRRRANSLMMPGYIRPLPDAPYYEGMRQYSPEEVSAMTYNPLAQINELQRSYTQQIGSLQDVTDSQKMALTSSLNAAMEGSISKAMQQAEAMNLQSRQAAINANVEGRNKAQLINDQYRDKYEDMVSKVMLADEMGRNKYINAINNDMAERANAVNAANTLSSMFPGMTVGPNGAVQYTNTENVLPDINFSNMTPAQAAAYVQAVYERYQSGMSKEAKTEGQTAKSKG